MHTFPRPAGAAPQRRARARRRRLPRLRRRRRSPSYRVLGEGGLWDVVKCQECLTSVSRERAPRLGSLTPLGLTIAMIGVDVGGTFTDVVAVRDGRIEVTKVPSDASEPATRGRRGRAPPRRARAARCSTTRARWGSTRSSRAGCRRSPSSPPRASATSSTAARSAARSTGRPTRPGGARSATPPARSSRATCAAAWSSGCSPTAASCARSTTTRRAASSRCCAAARSQGVAICLLNAYVNPAHEQRLRELTREVLGDDVAVSISSETSPLAKEYARASTTVDRRPHEAHLRALLDAARRRPARARLRRRAELRRLRGDAAALARGAARSRFASSSPARPPARSRARASAPRSGTGNLLCADVGGTSTDVSLVVDGAPFVNDTFEIEHDLVINALSTEVSSVGAGGGSIVSISPSGDVRVGPESAGSDPGPACYGRGGTRADADRRLPADGHPRSGRLRRRRDAPRSRARAAGVRGARHAALARAARVVRLPPRGRQHRRGGHQRRRPPRRRPARLHARRLRRRRPDAPARGARPAAGRAHRRSRRTPACSRRWACSAPTSSTTRAAARTSC